MINIETMEACMKRLDYVSGNEGFTDFAKKLFAAPMDLIFTVKYDKSSDTLSINEVIMKGKDDRTLKVITLKELQDAAKKKDVKVDFGISKVSSSGMSYEAMVDYFSDGIKMVIDEMWPLPLKVKSVTPHHYSAEPLLRKLNTKGSSSGAADDPKIRATLGKLFVDTLKSMASKDRLSAWVIKNWDLKGEIETFEQVFIKEKQDCSGFFSYGGEFEGEVAEAFHISEDAASDMIDKWAKNVVAELNKKLAKTAYKAGVGLDDTTIVSIAVK